MSGTLSNSLIASKRGKRHFGPMLLATILVGIAGAFITIAMPGILLALSQKVPFSATHAARFASFELGGMFVSTLFLGQLLNTRYRKQVLVVALMAVIVGNCASALLYNTDTLPFTRILTGLGGGIAVAALGAAAASFTNPDRLFALFMAVNMALVTIYLFFLPRVVLIIGIPGAFLILAGAGALALLSIPGFPSWVQFSEADSVAKPEQLKASLPLASILGLLGCLTLNLGVGMIWPFMGDLGKARGIPSEAISTYLAAATFAGIAAGIGAAVLGLRFGRNAPLAVATLGLIASAIGLTLEMVSFAVCTMMFLFFWTFAVAYFMGTVAAVPNGGRGAVLIPAAQQGGLALGPQLTALVASHASLAWTVIFGSAICAFGAAAAVSAGRINGASGHGDQRA